MTKILVLLQSDLAREQRIGKEIQSLQALGHTISLLEVPSVEGGREGAGIQGIDQHRIFLKTRGLPRAIPFLALKYAEMVVQVVWTGMHLPGEVIHCVDRPMLLPGYLIALFSNRTFIYDSQEIFSGTTGPLNRPRGLWLALERWLARRASTVLVTDHFRKKILVEILGLDPEKVKVVMNVPRAQDLAPCMRRLREEVGAASKDVVMVYAGLIAPHRGLEATIEALSSTPDGHHLAIVGFGEAEYIERLVLKTPVGIRHRVHYLPALPWNEVVSYIQEADVSLVFYPKDSQNNYYCSPSKLFDALLAGVPVLGTDNPLLMEVLEGENLGVCIPKVSAGHIRAGLEGILSHPAPEARTTRAKELARARYLWEHQEPVLREIYSKSSQPAETKR